MRYFIAIFLSALLITPTAHAAEADMVRVEGGCFEMGDSFGGAQRDELPLHEVCVEDFFIGRYEVTQREWNDIMGALPSSNKGCYECPVETIPRDGEGSVTEFLKRLNRRTGKNYRLPTEAEWEYAARSRGMNEKWPGTSDPFKLSEYGWYKANSEGKSHPVGRKKPNGLGLYDMGGNVWEWLSDYYEFRYYETSPKDNPKGVYIAKKVSLRGGSWYDEATSLRSANRGANPSRIWFALAGFRLARDGD